MHGIGKMTQMDIFYYGINYNSEGTMDSASGGAF